MLTLSATTTIGSSQAVDRALDYFVRLHKLSLIELAVHLHAHEGALDITVSGATLRGAGEHPARDVLRTVLEFTQARFGLAVVYYLLHLHAAPDESAGHLTVRINTGEPAEVVIESREFDREAREFLAGLPGRNVGP